MTSACSVNFVDLFDKYMASLRRKSGVHELAIDGITIVQKIRGDQKTFAEVADCMMLIVLHEGAES